MRPPFFNLTRRQATLALAGQLLLAVFSSASFATLTTLWLAWHAQPSFSALAWAYWVLPLVLLSQVGWKRNHPTRFIRAGVSATFVLVLALLAVAGLSITILGPLVAVGLVSLIASGRNPSASQRWFLAAAYGCAMGVAVALMLGFKPGFGAMFPPLLLVLLPSAALAGLMGEALHTTIARLLAHLRHRWAKPPTEEVDPTPASGISRRRLLLGAPGLAGLAATSAGVVWLTRRLTAPFLPLVTLPVGALSLSWSPDGKSIVTSSYDEVSMWDTTRGKMVHTLEIPFKVSQDTHVSGENAGVAWSPNGQHIAATLQEGLLIWDATTLRLLGGYSDPLSEQLSIPNYTFIWPALVWSPDSTRLAAINTPYISIFDATTGAILMKLHTPDSKDGFQDADDLAWSPDGNYLATASLNEGTHIWDVRRGEWLATLQPHTGIQGSSAVAWSPDSTRLASAGDNVTIWSWDGHTAQALLTYPGYRPSFLIDPIVWSPDGSRIASPFNDSVHVWDATTGQTIFAYHGHTRNVPITLVSWSPDGTCIASVGEDTGVHIWQPD